MNKRDILDRHQKSLQGTLRACLLSSSELGIKKPFYVYEPAGLENMSDVPTLFLFRGHEREWVNINEDSSRLLATAIEDLDKAIKLDMIPPVLVVMPGLNSSNNHVPSLGINMAGTWAPSLKGLGSGKYWNYLLRELIPTIHKRYPMAGGMRLAAGFSLGGFTASLLGVFRPQLFQHIGIYDGLFMWPSHHDPRATPDEPFNDNVWLKNQLFDAAFGLPRDQEALNRWNPSDRLQAACEDELEDLKQTHWWITSAVSDGQHGNRDRAQYYRNLLTEKGIPLGFDEDIFHPKAAHTWRWTDAFLISFLQKVFVESLENKSA